MAAAVGLYRPHPLVDQSSLAETLDYGDRLIAQRMPGRIHQSTGHRRGLAVADTHTGGAAREVRFELHPRLEGKREHHGLPVLAERRLGDVSGDVARYRHELVLTRWVDRRIDPRLKLALHDSRIERAPGGFAQWPVENLP